MRYISDEIQLFLSLFSILGRNSSRHCVVKTIYSFKLVSTAMSHSREFLDVALQLVALEDVESAVLGDGGHLDVSVIELLLHDLLQDGQRVLDGLLQRHGLVVHLLQRLHCPLTAGSNGLGLVLDVGPGRVHVEEDGAVLLVDAREEEGDSEGSATFQICS